MLAAVGGSETERSDGNRGGRVVAEAAAKSSACVPAGRFVESVSGV